MKAVAMSVDHTENDEAKAAVDPAIVGGAARDAAFKEAIARTMRREIHNAATIVQTTCFAVLWHDELGQCPETGCTLRKQCEATYDEALVQLRARPVAEDVNIKLPAKVAAAITQVPNPKQPPGKPKKVKKESLKAKQARAKANAAKKQPPKKVLENHIKAKLKKDVKHDVKVLFGEPPTARGKWRGTGKYQRLGYQPSNRPVDRALATFIEALGNPPRLPAVWSPIKFHQRFGHLGRITISQTASYTCVYVDGMAKVRFWVNAGGCALIDVVDELVPGIKTIDGVAALIEPIPANSWKKLRPCTHRFELAFSRGDEKDAILTTLAGMIRMTYRG